MNDDRQQKLDTKELEHRVTLFKAVPDKPWIECEATRKYFEIVNIKVKSLVRQLKQAKPDVSREILADMQGKIEMGENMCYMPHGAINNYDRYKAEQEKRETKKEENKTE